MHKNALASLFWEILLLNFIFRYNLPFSSYFSKKSDQNKLGVKIFSQNPIPILMYRKPNFLIFVRAHISMTSQKPHAGHVGTYFGINV